MAGSAAPVTGADVEAVAGSAGRWAADVAADADAWDRDGRVPLTVVRSAARAGVLGVAAPIAHGGQGAPASVAVAVLRSVARVARRDLATWLWCTEHVVAALLGAHEDAGGVALPVRAAAVLSGDAQVGLAPGDGRLVALGNGAAGALSAFGGRWAWVATAAVDDAAVATEGLAALGWVGASAQGSTVLALSEDTAAAIVARARVTAAAVALGAMQREVARAAAHARDRRVFGRSVADFQVQRHRFVDLRADVTRLAALVDATAARLDAGAAATHHAAAAARLAAELEPHVVDECLQVHGGAGYTRAVPVSRAWTDAHVAATLVLPGGPALDDPLPAAVAAPDPGVFGPDHDDFRARARAVVAAELVPHVAAWEQAGDFPKAVFRRLGDAGLLGGNVAPRWGGSGPDPRRQAVWVEEVARAGSGGLAADLGASIDLAALYVALAGDDAQKDRWLAPTVTGEKVGALAVTEPGAGSDVNGLRLRAVRDGDGWVLDGEKVFITNGSWCDYVVVAARTDPEADHAGISLFVVDAAVPGLARTRMRMLGWNASHTGALAFDGVRVPPDALLGDEGTGFLTIMRNFAWERLVLALGAVVAAQEALDATRADATVTTPADAARIAGLQAETLAARAMTHAVLRRHAAGEDVVVEVALAKLVTQRLAQRATATRLALLGPAGFARTHPAQWQWRDARLGPIGGGTDEIMREIVARAG